jgi:sulfoxide reductase heme-binding subunit YedZ
MGWWLGKEAGVLSQLADVFNLTAQTPWYLSRSGGTVGYLLLAGSTIWGLLLSSKIIKETLPAALSLAMHNILSWLAIAFTGVHMAALLFDNYFTYTLGDLLVPFIGPYEPGWVGLGVIGFYLMLLTTISFYFRKQIARSAGAPSII